MTAPAGATAYTFASVSFARLVSGEYPPWFGAKVEQTQDLVKGSDADYLDIGATAYEQLSLRAVVFSQSDRSAIEALLGTTAVLSNSRGRSQDATLLSAIPIDLGLDGFFAIDLIFMRRPTGS